MDKISVIVPVFNAEAYIAECLRSILTSTYQDIEVLVVDDASTDGSVAVAQSFAGCDSRVQLLRLHSNSGAAAARNYGIECSTGEFIAFVDADDYVDSDMLSVLMDLLNEYNADVSQISPRRVDDGRRILNQSVIDEFEPLSEKEKLHVYTGLEVIEYYLVRGHHALWGHLYRKELFDEVRIPEGMTEEDMTVVVPLYMQCDKVVRADVYKYNYRLNRGVSL